MRELEQEGNEGSDEDGEGDDEGRGGGALEATEGDAAVGGVGGDNGVGVDALRVEEGSLLEKITESDGVLGGEGVGGKVLGNGTIRDSVVTSVGGSARSKGDELATDLTERIRNGVDGEVNVALLEVSDLGGGEVESGLEGVGVGVAVGGGVEDGLDEVAVEALSALVEVDGDSASGHVVKDDEEVDLDVADAEDRDSDGGGGDGRNDVGTGEVGVVSVIDIVGLSGASELDGKLSSKETGLLGGRQRD